MKKNFGHLALAAALVAPFAFAGNASADSVFDRSNVSASTAHVESTPVVTDDANFTPAPLDDSCAQKCAEAYDEAIAWCERNAKFPHDKYLDCRDKAFDAKVTCDKKCEG